MKFCDGYWLMRPGVTPHYPAQVQEVSVGADHLTIFAATKRLAGRGDSLDMPLLSVHFSSPMPEVIRVQIYHHKGSLPRKPNFEITSQPADVQVQDDPEAVSLTSGRLSVRVQKTSDWRVEFKDGERLVASSPWRGMGYLETPQGSYIHESLSLGVGECVYGLGERFTALIKNGQVVEMWNADGGTSSEQAYKNIPFYLTNRGYGVFVNHPERVSFEVASEKVDRVQFSVPGEYLEYFLIYGPSPKEVLRRYTALTGRPALPPAWSFGLWLSTSFTTPYAEASITGLIEGMAARKLPLHVFHFDCFWMKALHWCDFEWDADCFPDPQGMLARLKKRGLHICVWINPYIAQQSALFDQALDKGYLLKRPDGSAWQWDRWQAGMGIVDFTNPAARQWYGDKLRSLLEMGVDCFKTDFGERIPTDVVYFDGSDPHLMHNYYSLLYNQTVFQVLEEQRGRGDALVFARSATAGSQQFPVHWGGDSTASYQSMAESLRGGLSLGISGFGFWSHDIGGFEHTATPDLYKRWCAFGLLSSHSRLHGSSSYRVPWLFDEEAVDVLRFFTRLKCSLMPYLYAAACQARDQGIPLLRQMLLEFPGDLACESLDRQYMLGDSLLVAPVFSADGVVDYYLPPGRWTHFLTGHFQEGGSWLRQTYDYFSLPLFARPGTVIPVGADSERPDYDYIDGVTFHVFEIQDGGSAFAQVPTLAGGIALTLEIGRSGDELTVNASTTAQPWSVILRGIYSFQDMTGGSAQPGSLGLILYPDPDRSRIKIRLESPQSSTDQVLY